MNPAWAARLPLARAAAVGRLRRRFPIEVLETGTALWLRGPDRSEALDRALRSIGDALRFDVEPGGDLVPAGRRLPTGPLPDGRWVALEDWLAPAPQLSALPGQTPTPLALTLVETGAEVEPDALLCRLDAFAAWARTAATVRLARLRFAAAGDGRALVVGRPLPPIPGCRLVVEDGIAVAAGRRWSPPVAGLVVRRVLGLETGDLALLTGRGDGAVEVEVVAADALVRADRAAVRRTLEAAR